MPLIVDTYNVLHTTGALPPELAGIDVPELAALIASSRYARRQCHLVCDGSPARGGHASVSPRIAITYSGPGRSADDVIISMIDRASHPRQITVVSSDQQVLRAARRRHCRRLASHRFLQQIGRDVAAITPRQRPLVRKPGAALTPEEVSHEVARFGLSAEELQRIEHDRQPKRSDGAAPNEKPLRPKATHATSRGRPASRRSEHDPVALELDRFGLSAADIAAIEAERVGPAVKRNEAPAAPRGDDASGRKAKDASRTDDSRRWSKIGPFPEDVLADAERLARGEESA